MSDLAPQRVVEPPKLFLDTNHIIEITKLRRGGKLANPINRRAYAYIDACIRDGRCALVFDDSMALEWVDGGATEESASAIAAVFDSALLLYLIEHDTFVYLREVLRECRRLKGDTRVSQLPLFHLYVPGSRIESSFSVLKRECPDYFDQADLGRYADDPRLMIREIELPPVSEYVTQAFSFKQEKPDVFRERVDGHKAAMNGDISGLRKRPGGCFTHKEIVDWMRHGLRADRALRSFYPGQEIDDLLNSVELARCPAANLRTDAWRERAIAGNEPGDNDSDDWSYICAVPYVDIYLTERHMRAMLRQADSTLWSKVTSSPSEAVEMLKRLTKPAV